MTCKTVKFSWARVDQREGDECWPWIGRLNTWGYGACKYQGKYVNASRAAYLETYGDIGDGLVVCHRCDNRACCNPAHLFVGTQGDNIRDCKEKGRWRNASGADHPRVNAKLTDELVREARRLYEGGISQSEIGRRWGIHSSVISRAVRGKNWSHVK